MCYFQIDPYFPKFLIDHGNMNQMYTGLNMAVFAGSKLIGSLLAGAFILNEMDGLKVCFLGAVFDMLYLLGMGCLDFFDD